MEDEHVLEIECLQPLRVLGAVFDGHGGREVAALARARFPELFRAALPRGSETAFRAAFARIDEEARGLDGGAVAVGVYVDGPDLVVANVGDAHAVLVGEQGCLRLTVDHRVTTEAERTRVERAGAVIWGPYVCLPEGPGLMPTRSLGDHPFRRVGVLPDPAVSRHAVRPGFLVAACDGLWDVLSEDEVPRFAKGAGGAKTLVHRLAHEALEVRRTPDNLTILAIRLRRTPQAYLVGPNPSGAIQGGP